MVGGYYPRGGTYMAYHIGRILHRRFGYECIIVRLLDENHETGVFSYPDLFCLVDFNFMVRNIGEGDILIANPSFSNLFLGPRLPGTKLMYIQDWKTYSVLLVDRNTAKVIEII